MLSLQHHSALCFCDLSNVVVALRQDPAMLSPKCLLSKWEIQVTETMTFQQHIVNNTKVFCCEICLSNCQRPVDRNIKGEQQGRDVAV